jgi:putative transposase
MKGMKLPKMSTIKPFEPKHKAASDENCPNILKQQVNPSEPNKVWVCDFTYLRATGIFYHLCVILDLFSRKVIVYKLSSKLNTKLAIDTLDMAAASRNISEGLIFHSDRTHRKKVCKNSANCGRI